MDRRQFSKSLGAACLASGARYSSGLGILNSVSSLAPSSAPASPAAILPLPSSVETLNKPILELAGKWLFAPDPGADFWKQNADVSGWKEIDVPSEFEMLGFPVSQEVEYPCRKSIQIPAEFADHRIFLRFDGVYCYARVWINGSLVREHNGGFTSWDAEITGHVQPGSSAELVVGVTDRSDSISQGSYYAKHSIAGILRDVRMFAVPKTHLSGLAITVSSDNKQTGLISVKASLSSADKLKAQLRFTLRDSSGKNVPLEPSTEAEISPLHPLAHELRAMQVNLWDSEHPNLYRLEIALAVNGNQHIETIERFIGFRSVERMGNQLLVNGQPVKLHGVCRHSIHPLYGRAVPAEFDEKDVLLFREANINFVRTSHYPPTEAFLDACDRLGMYIEEETAVCWSRASSSQENLHDEFLGQFREMIARDRHHACVLFWSLGNESEWGTNIAAERAYVREHDPGRPNIFSYPDTVPMATDAFDIYSKHYPDVHSNLDSPEYPLLNDEFGHVSCYNLDTLRRDPGVRNFWGESIQRFGDKFLSSDGCLGGSIWAGIDDIFLLPHGPAGYGEWGVIDGWRRRKPEHWLTRKAFSPIRLPEADPLPLPEPGTVLLIPIRNAFNHTNLKEIEITWAVRSESGKIGPVDLAPHSSGFLPIPPRQWQHGDRLQLEFHARGTIVEQASLLLGSEMRPAPHITHSGASGEISLTDRVNDTLIAGPRFSITIDRQTGLIAQASLDRTPILQGGPFLDLGRGAITSWLLTKSIIKADKDRVVLLTTGESKEAEGISAIPVQFEMEVDRAGKITTRFRAEIRSGAHLNLGIAYLLPRSFDRLAWRRKALWSHYPEDHIGRPQGVALRRPGHRTLAYREEPVWSWSQDEGNPFLWGKPQFDPGGTNDFRSLKPNIWWASLGAHEGKAKVRTEANADAAVRASAHEDAVCFSIYNYWSYPDLEWGNYTGMGAPPAVTIMETTILLTDLPDEEA